MFPGSSRVRSNCKILPLGAVSHLALNADDADLVVLELFNAAWHTSTIKLPASAVHGKRFEIVMKATPALATVFTVHYIDVLVPLTGGGNGVWRLHFGQRPTFVFGPGGWIVDQGGGSASKEGAPSAFSVAIGNYANGNDYGVAIGYGATGKSFGVAIGYNAIQNSEAVSIGYGAVSAYYAVSIGRTAVTANYGVAIGYNATAIDGQGVAIGSIANGYLNGTAIGYQAVANDYGVSVGQQASSQTSGSAVGYQAQGQSYGAALGSQAQAQSYGVAVGMYSYAVNYGVALGHRANCNNLDKAVALGYYSKAERYREMVKSADGASVCKQSWSMVNWYGDTTNATATELLLGGTAAQRCILLSNSAIQFVIQIIAGVTAAGDTSSWTISGAIKCGATAATTALVGTPVVTMTGQDAGAAAWAVAVTADTTNGALKLTVTGQSATTIRWNATATLSEMRF